MFKIMLFSCVQNKKVKSKYEVFYLQTFFTFIEIEERSLLP